MKIYKQPCALCSANDPEILFPASYKNSISKFENIVICKRCGLVYKYPVVPESEVIHYMGANHWNRRYFNEKLFLTAEFVSGNVQNAHNILDIGAAAGHLLHHLSMKYPNATLTGIEPSQNACNEALMRNSKLHMLASAIEDVQLPKESFDLITVIGVDYLFLDHVAGLKKIKQLLSSDGRLYIERNVFLDSKAFVSSAINNRNDLFGLNSMMKNWFTVGQMRLQCKKFFEVLKENSAVTNIVRGHKNIMHGWLCKNSVPLAPVSIPNKYAENKNYILKHLR